MSIIALCWVVSRLMVRSLPVKEEVMSNLKYAIIEEEFGTTVEVLSEQDFGKPYLVETPDREAGPLTRRVEAVLDREFANGSMPA